MNYRNIISLFAICFLVFGFSYGSVFYLNTSVPYDMIWNDTDEYSAWLDYLNPYSYGSCDDLRECYIDDSNILAFDHTFIMDNFFSDNPNLVPVYSNFTNKENKQQLNPDGVPYSRFTIAFYNDTTTGLISAIVQKGTTWDIYEDLVIYNDSYIVDSVGWFNQSSIGYIDIVDNPYYKLTAYDLYTSGNISVPMAIRSLYLKNDDVIILLFQFDENGEKVDSTALVVNHYDQYEFGYTLIGNTTTADLNQISATSGTDYYGTLDSSLQFLVNQYQQTNLVQHLTHKFHGLYLDISNPLTRNAFVLMPKIQYKVDGTYKSVSLPSCEDIATGNEQTDFLYNVTESQWYRECSGVVPTPETYTCDLDCVTPSYPTTTENCSLYSPFFYANSHSATFRTHILQPTNPDGWGYCFLDTQDLSSIQDMRLYSALYDVEYLDNTETQGLYGILGVYDRTMFGKSCDSGATNTTLFFNDVNSFNSYLDLSSEYWDWDNQDTLYNNVEVLLKSWLYDNLVPDSACDPITYPLTTDQYFAVENGLTPNKTISQLQIWLEYDNQTSTTPDGCLVYDTFCYPDVPIGYVYDEADIVCVGSSCYVESYPTCNHDTICNTPYETNALCPDDCPTLTTEEQTDIVTGIINNTTNFVADILGTDQASIKGMAWMILSIIASVGIGIVIAKSGGEGIGMIILIMLFIMMLIGTLISWLPLWIGILFLVMDGFLIAFAMRSIFVS